MGKKEKKNNEAILLDNINQNENFFINKNCELKIKKNESQIISIHENEYCKHSKEVLENLLWEICDKDESHKKIDKILKLGIDPNLMKENCNFTPFHWACCMGKLENVKIFLKYHVDINCLNRKRENTPLISSLINKQKEVVYLLIKYDLNPFLINIFKHSAIYYIYKHGFEDLLEVFKVKYKIKVSFQEFKDLIDFFCVNKLEHSKSFKLFIDYEEYQIKKYLTINILLKILDKNETIFEKLSPYYDKENQLKNNKKNTKDQNGLLFSLCSIKEDSQELEILLKTGIIKNILNEDWTPLNIACRRGFYKTVDILIKYGAEVNFIDSKGKTPFYYSFIKKHYDITDLLLSRGTIPTNSKDKFFSILYYAYKYGSVKYINIFQDKFQMKLTQYEFEELFLEIVNTKNISTLYLLSSYSEESIFKYLSDDMKMDIIYIAPSICRHFIKYLENKFLVCFLKHIIKNKKFYIDKFIKNLKKHHSSYEDGIFDYAFKNNELEIINFLFLYDLYPTQDILDSNLRLNLYLKFETIKLLLNCGANFRKKLMINKLCFSKCDSESLKLILLYLVKQRAWHFITHCYTYKFEEEYNLKIHNSCISIIINYLGVKNYFTKKFYKFIYKCINKKNSHENYTLLTFVRNTKDPITLLRLLTTFKVKNELDQDLVESDDNIKTDDESDFE